MAVRGIDVSSWQGNIDFNKVKASGIDFVIIRAGYGTSGRDKWFQENYRKAKAAGLHVGAYWYSYAGGFQEAEREADMFISLLKGKQFDYPVYFDMEEKSQLNEGRDFCSGLIRAFCNRMEEAGYFAGFYTSASYARSVVTDEVRKRYSFWCAEWGRSCSYEGSCGVWQKNSNGSVPGISGRVDEDISYKDFPSVIVSGGFNGYSKASAPVEKKSVDEIAEEVLNGDWGSGEERKKRLSNAGYDYNAVQAIVNERLKPKAVCYTVRRGDTLTGIASRYGTTVSNIQKLNKSLIKNVNQIQVGWKIQVK